MSILRRGLGLTKAHISMRVPAAPIMAGGLFTGSAGLAGGMIPQMSAYSASGTLFSVVNLISQSVGMSDWHIYRKTNNGDRIELPNHPALDLWQSVSPFESGESFMEAGQQYLDLTGEWWTLIIRNARGVPVELQLIRPDRIRPIPSRDKFIAGYIYTIGTERIPLDPTDILMIKLPNPLDPYRGLGPVQAMLVDLDMEQQVSAWQRNFYKNSAEPGGIIEFDDEIDDAQYEKLVRRWADNHQGVNNAHRVAVLERGRWHDRKITHREMQFTEGRRFNRDLVLWTFRVHPHMMGISDNVNRANAEAAEVTFLRWVIVPRLSRIRAMLNENFLPLWDSTGTLEFDFEDPTPADREHDLLEAIQGYTAGLLTLNEGRDRLGEGMVPDGDDFKEAAAPVPAPEAPPAERMVKVAHFKGARQSAEATLFRNWSRRLDREADQIIEYLGQFASSMQPGMEAGYDWDWRERYYPAVVEELRVITLSMLVETFPNLRMLGVQKAPPDVGSPLAQLYAEEYARERAAELLLLDSPLALTSVIVEELRVLIADTLANGRPLNELQRQIRQAFGFSKQRAELIARTETATALGQGSRWAAQHDGLDEKRWVTQGDDAVDDACSNNEAQGWIGITDIFSSGDDNIPQHPACRCTIIYRATVPPAPVVAQAPSGARQVDEVRCEKCGQKVAGQFRGTAMFRCRRCKIEFEYSTIQPGLKVIRKVVERDQNGQICAVTEEHG